MDDFARQSAEIRAEFFTETAARMGVQPSIIEKDFWVCWTLKRVFTLEAPIAGLIFKGGTSLSKAYGAIRRFSEDIDLSLDRHDLGFDRDRDPANPELSNKQRKVLLKELRETASSIVRGELRNQISSTMQAALPDATIDLSIDVEDDQTLLFTYPASLSEALANAYIPSVVKLEFGARSDHVPAEQRSIRCYVADEFPNQTLDAEVDVKTLGIERTFWEKATILHMLCHQTPDKALNKTMSRHYYDLAELAKSETKDKALANLALLDDVALHKRQFFQAAWANYEAARPPTLRLVPGDQLELTLRRDYSDMKEMLFDEPPAFENILKTIRALETEINAMASDLEFS